MKNNILTDEILVQALGVYEKAWLENTQFDESEFNPSEKFKKKMNRIFKSYDNVYYKMTLTKARRIAVIVAAIIAIMCSSLSVSAVREALSDFFIKTFSTYDLIEPDTKTVEENNPPQYLEKIYELGYVPEGFELVEESITEGGAIYVYVSDNKRIIFSQFTKYGLGMGIDNERSIKSYEVIGNQSYIVYISTNSSDITVIWDDGEYLFALDSNLSKEETINLCTSLKVKEN